MGICQQFSGDAANGILINNTDPSPPPSADPVPVNLGPRYDQPSAIKDQPYAVCWCLSPSLIPLALTIIDGRRIYLKQPEYGNVN
jgi:hypothetical protein